MKGGEHMQISLRAARINANLTQKQAAQAIGANPGTIVSWETGKTSPTAMQLQRLCELYKIGIDSIFLCQKSN